MVPEHPNDDTAELEPVFADPTGRRRRVLRQVAVAGVALVTLYVAVLVATLLGARIAPAALLPLPGSPTHERSVPPAPSSASTAPTPPPTPRRSAVEPLPPRTPPAAPAAHRAPPTTASPTADPGGVTQSPREPPEPGDEPEPESGEPPGRNKPGDHGRPDKPGRGPGAGD